MKDLKLFADVQLKSVHVETFNTENTGTVTVTLAFAKNGIVSVCAFIHSNKRHAMPLYFHNHREMLDSMNSFSADFDLWVLEIVENGGGELQEI